ncbi:hypothetical protein JCM9533A_23010 [Catenuloplanes niger JCM 9533]
MVRRFHQIVDDIKQKRSLDLYATTVVAFIFGALLLIGADLPDNLRWSLLFAGIGFLLLRVALAAHQEERFLDRSDYDRHPISDALRTAREVWIFAPVGTNFLTNERCEMLRRGALARNDGTVRIVTLRLFDENDPIAAQLDALLDHPVQAAAASMREIRNRLEAMSRWQVSGDFAYGEIPFNPGFSIVAIDPQSPRGFANVEFHGFRNDTIGSRMHIHLTRADGQWFKYWLEQFEEIWRTTQSAGTHTPIE